MEKSWFFSSIGLTILFVVLLSTQEVFFLRYVFETLDNLAESGDFLKAGFLRLGSEKPNLPLKFSITICPQLLPSMPTWRNLSSIQQRLLRSVAKHRAFSANCSIDSADFVVISFDAISRDPLDTGNFNENLLTQLSQFRQKSGNLLSEKAKFVLFNAYAGTWPNYDDRVDFDLRQSILVKTGLSNRTVFEHREIYKRDDLISFPLFQSTHPFRGRFPASQKTHASKYLLTFKGKRYLTGAGIRPRNQLFRLHNDLDVVMLTTCRHGKDWKRQEDARCSIDNKNYDKYDYSDLIANSTFCLVPRGRRLASYRFLEVLQQGCIPVVAADSWVLPFSKVIDWKKAAVFVQENNLMQISSSLSSISFRERIQMREFGRFLYEAYFSSIEQMVFTTIEILHDSTLPNQLKRPPPVWNRWPGGLVVDYANYSQNLGHFPFYCCQNLYTAASVLKLKPSSPFVVAFIKLGSHRDCKLKVGSTMTQASNLLASTYQNSISKVNIDNRCWMHDRQFSGRSDALFVDSELYLRRSRLSTPALLFVDPFWLQAENNNSHQVEALLASFVANQNAIGVVSLKRLRVQHGIAPSCSGSVVIPDFTKAVVFHRYFLHRYATAITKSVRDQASRMGHCEHLLFTAAVGHATWQPRPFSVVARRPDGDSDGVIMCACLKLVTEQFGYLPLSSDENMP